MDVDFTDGLPTELLIPPDPRGRHEMQFVVAACAGLVYQCVHQRSADAAVAVCFADQEVTEPWSHGFKSRDFIGWQERAAADDGSVSVEGAKRVWKALRIREVAYLVLDGPFGVLSTENRDQALCECSPFRFGEVPCRQRAHAVIVASGSPYPCDVRPNAARIAP